MRIALISDEHFGPKAFFDGKLRKLSHEAGRLCADFVRAMNEREHPDLVVNLGDVIEDQNRPLDLENYQRFLDVMSGLQAPILHVAGNHDSINLSDDDLCALWQHAGPLHYSRDIGGIHFTILRSVEHKDVAVRLPDEQLAWLERDLASTSLPVIVLVHHPLSEMDLTGNHWFEHFPHICRVAERRQARTLIEASGKVLCVINGHVHWNHLDVIRGIPYVTVQSLIENLDEDAPGRPASAWAICDIDPHRIHVRIAGADPARYQFER